ncbi:MAG: hypothetical protein H0T97_03395 [Actinobacteria bacterium]|nr:hypothetical protein [Actinomycetota bacterium]
MDATKTATKMWKRVDQGSPDLGVTEQYILEGAEGQLIGFERYEDGRQSDLVSLPQDFAIPSNFTEVDALEKVPAGEIRGRLASH